MCVLSPTRLICAVSLLRKIRPSTCGHLEKLGCSQESRNLACKNRRFFSSALITIQKSLLDVSIYGF